MKKREYKPKKFESKTDENNKYIDSQGKSRTETSANIYESMLTAPAFIGLKPKQQILYVYIKAQFYGHRKPKKDYPDIDDYKGNDCFYFNWQMAQDYQLYKPSMARDFYRDMKALQEAGFIDKISSGQSNHKRNIYKFSSRWHKTKTTE